MEMQRGVRYKPALFIHLQRDGGNLKQRIGFSVKSGCFYINDNGIKTTKTVAQTGKLSVIGHQGLLQGGKSSAHYGKF
ncbi:Uncharacterised protein [Enterobacter cloacae]|nr:Uncharacterised protein [Enterobacter cloacae]